MNTQKARKWRDISVLKNAIYSEQL